MFLLLAEENGPEDQLAMCFLPNIRASTDQAPGPIIAKVPPKTANINDISLPFPVIAIHNWKRTTSVPATGVHKPINMNTPNAAPMNCGRGKTAAS